MIRRIRTRVVNRVRMGVGIIEIRKVRAKIIVRIGVIIIRINYIRGVWNHCRRVRGYGGFRTKREKMRERKKMLI